jgi:beta-glucosidase-like glycosyl hydrolase
MKRLMYLTAVLFFAANAHAQRFLEHSAKADKWVDSVYRSLTPQQRIAQLMVIRESSMENNQPIIFSDSIKNIIKQYNIGAICLFQGEANEQAKCINEFQQLAQTPLLVCIDGETGLGMRMDEVGKFPDQITLGAMRHADKLVYKMGRAIAEQCKRIGINLNYAPVVDINNNPKNPIIGYRSFGQDKYVVADYGIAVMRGLQDNGVMACAKHFPGHGDVNVDSHLDLPVIRKSLQSLDTLELYPFKKIFKAGIGSVMIAHLFIPMIDSTPHLASSLSPKFVTDLLRKQLNFNGISFTDALEMQGVAKYFPQGEIAVKSLLAGNDMLCLPGNIDQSIQKIMAAINDGKLSWSNIENSVKKVLYAKYNLGLNKHSNVDTTNLVADLNKDVKSIRAAVAKQSLTAVKLENRRFAPIRTNEKIAYVAIGINSENTISKEMKNMLNADVFTLPRNATSEDAQTLFSKISAKHFDRIIVGLHHFGKYPANNFGINNAATELLHNISQSYPSAMVLVFGNPYAIANVADFKNIIACYEDDEIFQQNTFDFLTGKTFANGRLSVSVNDDMPYGTGILVKAK